MGECHSGSFIDVPRVNWITNIHHILAGNRTYFAAISLFRSQLLTSATKIILYKTLIRPVVSYGAEAWTLTKKEEQALIFLKENV